jgi:circadian clock protein KaiC
MGSDYTAGLASLGDVAPGPVLPKAATGISGLDAVLGGGLPLGRSALVLGPAGSGKTLMAVQFLVSGARDEEPGVLVTFEESADKVAANVASLGIDISELEEAGRLTVIAFEPEPSEAVASGEYDFEPLFLRLGAAIDRIGAKRVVLDAVEVLYGSFTDAATVRSELHRLIRWLEARGVTAVITGERGDAGLTRHGIEEYVSDCVLVLDHRVHNEVSTRRLRVVKYRGSAHGTNEYPFYIGNRGIEVLPITSISLTYGASSDRVPLGVPRLDHMLGGGVYRGSTVLVTGNAGTGKTTLGAHLVNSACDRGETCLVVLFEESPAQVMRNMTSIGLNLQQWVDAGLLHMWAARPPAFGLEAHLSILSRLVDELAPSIVVLDGIGSFQEGPNSLDVTWMVARQLDLLKSRQITTLATSVVAGDENTEIGVSSMVDTWIVLRNVEQNGERNRLLYVLKSRGTAHSNQVREFVLTNDGAEIVDVYLGEEGVLTGSARLVQEERERRERVLAGERAAQRRRELVRTIMTAEAAMAEATEDLGTARRELKELDANRERDINEASNARESLASRRWADPEPPGRG